ncbi:MAG: outer rane biosis protein BamB [Planctomycetaceae bacterium]|nr:outer rane biosis protein BamB [Planctomycetaceae bacterium]
MWKSFSLAVTLGFVVVASATDRSEPRLDIDNWPSWRGPTANGIAPAGANPPTKWDAKTNIKWKVEIPGRGSATPIVWGDQVFVLTSMTTDREAKPEELPKPDPRFVEKTKPSNHFQRFEVLCFDRQTGELRWRKTAAEAVPHEGHHDTHSYAGGSPATDGKRLYASFGSFGIYAYDLTGNLLWKRDLGRLHTRFGWGEAVTPVVHGDSLVLNWDQEADSRLIVLDAATGETRWEVPRDDKSSWNTPAVVPFNGKTQVIVNGTKRVRSYDLADGKEIWEVGGMTVNAIPSPLVADGIAYVMSGYTGAAAVAVPLSSTGDLTTPEKTTSGTVAWRYDKGTPYVPSPILVDGRLYFTKANTQVLTVLDAKTGKPIGTSERIPGATSFYASPAFAAGHLYFSDQSGTTVVIKPSDQWEVVATNKLDETIDASPVIVGKTLFLRTAKHLYAIEEK